MPMTGSEPMLEVVVAWLDAMRRGEADAAAECFHSDVVWQGLPHDAVCRNREEVRDMLRRTIARGRPRAQALELIAGDRAVALGICSPELRQIGDVALPGQLYNVFQIREGRIAAARDFAHREEALRAAGATRPDWT
jgi:ketosteroid isomerase-like protein